MLVLAGQSNMVGQALWEGRRLPDSLPQVKVLDLDGVWKGQWITLRRGLGADSSRFGIEIPLALTLLDSVPQDSFFIVKAAWSSTSLAEYWHSPTPSGFAGSLYSQMLQGVKTARDSLSGPLPPIDGFFWMQGESDALYQPFADDYFGNFTGFVEDLRKEWGDSTLPFVVGLIDKQPVWTYATTVREAQIQVCVNHSYMGFVETGGLETDGVHYTGAGLEELGRRMALKWLETMKGRPKPPPTVVIPHKRVRGIRMADGSTPLRIRILRLDGSVGSWQSLDFLEGNRSDRARASDLRFVQLQGRDGRLETRRFPPNW